MKHLTVSLLISVICSQASADLDGVLNRAGGFFAGINSCGEVTPQTAGLLNRSLPCVNYFGSYVDNQDAWEKSQSIVFAELARRNRSESACRVEFFSRGITDENFADTITEKMIPQFLKIRAELRRIRAAITQNGDDFVRNSRLIMQPEGAAALAYGAAARDTELNNQLKRLLATVPLGHEPEVAEFLIRADAELPADFYKTPQGIGRFRDSLPAVFSAAAQKYIKNQDYLSGKTADEITEDDRERFGEARVLEDFVAALAVPPAAKEVLYCRLDAKYQRGQDGLQKAELIFTGLSFALLAGVTVVSGGAASPVTVPLAIALGAVTAASAVNQINQTIRQCYGESFVVARKANTCNPNQEVDALTEAAQNNKCYGAAALSVVSVAGVAADVVSALRGLKVLRRAGANTLAESVESAPVGTIDNAASSQADNAAASQADNVGDEIIVTAPSQNYDISRVTTRQRQSITSNRRFKRVLDGVAPNEKEDAISILAILKNQNNPPLSDAEVANKFNRLVASGSCSVGGRR